MLRMMKTTMIIRLQRKTVMKKFMLRTNTAGRTLTQEQEA